MNIKDLSSEMLLFHYISNKEQMAILYKRQNEIEEEMKVRKKIMLESNGVKGDKQEQSEVVVDK